ncbi:MAG: FHA domain-containing protein, partial [bacterium]
MPSETTNKSAVIRYISGSRRGLAQTLDQKTFFIIRAGSEDVNIVPPDSQPEPEVIATLHRHGLTFEVEVNPVHEVWINGEQVMGSRALETGDLIELGHAGPVVRFRLYPKGVTPKKTLAEALADSIDCAKVEGHSGIAKAGRFVAGFTHDLATQTTAWFRFWMLVLITLVIASLVVLVMQNYQFQQQLSSESIRLEGIARLLEKTGAEAMTREDLVKLRQEMGSQLDEAVQRVEFLEARSDATGKIIKQSTNSIAFIQGQYGFFDSETGSALRYLVTPQGILFFTADDGEKSGDIVKINFSGTGFVVSDKGNLLTNRHIAEPWLMKDQDEAPNIEGMDPQILGLRAFLPGQDAALE